MKIIKINISSEHFPKNVNLRFESFGKAAAVLILILYCILYEGTSKNHFRDCHELFRFRKFEDTIAGIDISARLFFDFLSREADSLFADFRKQARFIQFIAD